MLFFSNKISSTLKTLICNFTLWCVRFVENKVCQHEHYCMNSTFKLNYLLPVLLQYFFAELVELYHPIDLV